MPYFHQVDDYRTYKGSDADFHFDYNANSGGGQPFFGGSFYDGADGLVQLTTLQDYEVSFAVRYPDSNAETITVHLDSDERARYRLVPRGNGSSQMKLQIEGGSVKKVTPSLLMTAFFMLPTTCGVNMAGDLDVSPLTSGNYWLRSMWLKCEARESNKATFIPQDFIYSGGASKRRGVATVDNKVTGKAGFFQLDYSTRMRDVIKAAAQPNLYSDAVARGLDYFAAVYSNRRPFSYEGCRETADEIMKQLAKDYPEAYSGYSDPMPLIVQLASQAPRITSADLKEPRNLIYFGAPGTGSRTA